MQERIGHYRILKPLGEGAMGTVYQGVDEKLNMQAAVKVLAPSIAADPRNIARFEQEARAAANLRHPNIAHVFFVGRTEKDLPFYAMEFIDGPSLEDALHRRMRVTGRQMITIMQQSCAALQFAAGKGVLHRDIKPGNIMIARDAGAKIVDFGIAKLSEGNVAMTTTGVILGTPNYISPEQAHGNPTDFRSDMYSLGVTFFELLTGNLPYTADTPVAVIMKHAQEPVPDIHSVNNQYPRSLCRIIERMMAKEPADRNGNYGEIMAQLGQVAAAEHEFVRSEWTHCAHCGGNTRVDPGMKCSKCGGTLGLSMQDEVFMSVRLSGFNTKDARSNVVQYLMSATGRSEAIIQKILDGLPMTLSPRLTLARAKALQKKMYDMGADVTLQKVATEKVKVGEERQALEMAGADGVPVSPEIGGKAEPETEEKGGRFRPAILIASVAAAAAVITGILIYTNKVRPLQPAEKQAAAVSGQAQAHQAAPANRPAAAQDGQQTEKNGTASGESGGIYTSHSGGCTFAIEGEADDAFLESLGEICEDGLRRLKASLGTTSSPRMRFTVDAKRDFALMAPLLGVGRTASGTGMVIAARSIRTDSPEARGAVVAMAARRILRNAGGSLLPAWLEAGFSLSMAGRIVQGSYDPRRVLSGTQVRLEDDVLDEALKENNPLAYAQAAALVGCMTRESGPGSILELAGLLKEGSAVEDAIMKVFSRTRADFQKECR
jgi:serine/threonine protein kinase